jgi:glycosyltransferase involved in cell wall biosynthesis
MPYGLVSCIVPVCNGGEYVAAALRSIVNQTYRSIEILVVDDGSDDGSADIALRACPRATIVRQVHAGPGAARNRGVALGRGRWLAFLDAEDLWHREKLAKQLAALEQLPHHGLTLAHMRNFWSPELPESVRRRHADLVCQAWPGVTCSTLVVRRKVFDQIGPFSESAAHGRGSRLVHAGRPAGRSLPRVAGRAGASPDSPRQLEPAAARGGPDGCRRTSQTPRRRPAWSRAPTGAVTSGCLSARTPRRPS